MSTTIKIECWKDDKTTIKQWGELINYINDNFEGVYDEDDYFISIPPFNCSYSRAGLIEQFNKDIMNKLKDSGITINLWFEERDPDETITL